MRKLNDIKIHLDNWAINLGSNIRFEIEEKENGGISIGYKTIEPLVDKSIKIKLNYTAVGEIIEEVRRVFQIELDLSISGTRLKSK